MGIDVFGVFQRRVADKWEFVSAFYDGQRGPLRVWLGWESYYWPLNPLAPTLGLPPDFDLTELVPPQEEGDWEDEICVYLGDHKRSWLSADEILAGDPGCDPGISGEIFKFKNLVRQLCERHGQIRFIFGFS